MPITVREVWQLEEFRVFRLVAGESGLEKETSSVWFRSVMNWRRICRLIFQSEMKIAPGCVPHFLSERMENGYIRSWFIES